MADTSARRKSWEWRAHCPTVPPHFGDLTRRRCRRYPRPHGRRKHEPSRKPITAQNMDEAKAAAYANDPQTELVIPGLSENGAVTTCGWARRFFDRGGLSLF